MRGKKEARLELGKVRILPGMLCLVICPPSQVLGRQSSEALF